jgi:hypothetical protein
VRKIIYAIFPLTFIIRRKEENPVGWINEERLLNREEEQDYSINRK